MMMKNLKVTMMKKLKVTMMKKLKVTMMMKNSGSKLYNCPNTCIEEEIILLMQLKLLLQLQHLLRKLLVMMKLKLKVMMMMKVMMMKNSGSKLVKWLNYYSDPEVMVLIMLLL